METLATLGLILLLAALGFAVGWRYLDEAMSIVGKIVVRTSLAFLQLRLAFLRTLTREFARLEIDLRDRHRKGSR